MNWKFWKKKTPAPEPVTPVGPKPPDLPAMTDVEVELLRLLGVEKWSLRDWKKGEDGPWGVRATLYRLGVSIDSYYPTDGYSSQATAMCGPLRFGDRFAQTWHASVVHQHEEAQRTERLAAEGAVQARLTQALFGP